MTQIRPKKKNWRKKNAKWSTTAEDTCAGSTGKKGGSKGIENAGAGSGSSHPARTPIPRGRRGGREILNDCSNREANGTLSTELMTNVYSRAP